MPSCISAGTVVSIAKQSQELSALHITVRLEAGESDWTSSQAFTIPIMSATQWEQLGPTTAWVFSGYLDVLPHYMWQPKMFCLVGWAIVVSSAVLLCVPWQWHQRLGERVLPLLVRHLRLYAAGSFAFGALLLYGVFAAGGSRAG